MARPPPSPPLGKPVWIMGRSHPPIAPPPGPLQVGLTAWMLLLPRCCFKLCLHFNATWTEGLSSICWASVLFLTLTSCCCCRIEVRIFTDISCLFFSILVKRSFRKTSWWCFLAQLLALMWPPSSNPGNRRKRMPGLLPGLRQAGQGPG